MKEKKKKTIEKGFLKGMEQAYKHRMRTRHMPNKIEENKHKSIKQREQIDGYMEEFLHPLTEYDEELAAEDAAVDYDFEKPVDKKK